MYGLIKRGSTGEDIKLLCQLLGIKEIKESFDEFLEMEVKKFQASHSLVSDGIVGYNTWKALLLEKHKTVTDETYKDFSDLLGIEKAALKAVVKVEAAGSGFLGSGRPKILFEAHIFYKQLKNQKINPDPLIKTHPGIISKTWNKALYKGGEKEWDRLQEAIGINKTAAYMSASFGLFQICGFNYKACSCKNVEEFVERMKKNEVEQLALGIEFIRSAGLLQHLKTKNWAKFAYGYNGAGYKQNAYDTKLKTAYEGFRK